MSAAGFKPQYVSGWMGNASVSATDGINAQLHPRDYTEHSARIEAFVTEG